MIVCKYFANLISLKIFQFGDHAAIHKNHENLFFLTYIRHHHSVIFSTFFHVLAEITSSAVTFCYKAHSLSQSDLIHLSLLSRSVQALSAMVKLGSNLSDKLEKQLSADDGFDNIPLIMPLEVNQLQQSFAEKVHFAYYVYVCESVYVAAHLFLFFSKKKCISKLHSDHNKPCITSLQK